MDTKWIILFFICIAIPGFSQEPSEKPQVTPEKVDVQAVEMEMENFLDLSAQNLQKTILHDNTVKGRKVFIHNMQSISKQDWEILFLAVMEHQGYIVEEIGPNKEILKIKRNIVGPWTPTPVLTNPEELARYANKDAFITLVVHLKYVNAQEMQTVLRALRLVNPQGGNLGGFSEGTSCLLVTDTAPNVKRIYEVIQCIDKKPDTEKVANVVLPVEDQKLVFTIPANSEVAAIIQIQQNITLTLRNDKGMVILAQDPQTPNTKFNLAPYAANAATLHWELQVLDSAPCQASIQLETMVMEPKLVRNLIWNFALHRALPKGKVIRFTTTFEK